MIGGGPITGKEQIPIEKDDKKKGKRDRSGGSSGSGGKRGSQDPENCSIM